MSAPPEAALRTRGLRRRMGREFTLRDVSMTVPRGAVYGLLGPNGAGKTTTLRLVMGLLRPEAGEVEVMGIDARREGARARALVGFVPDPPAVADWMTAARAMRHHAAFHARWDAAYAAALARRLGLPLDRPLRRLSRGEAAKTSLLLALADRPPLLLLDEPTGALDPVARRQVTELLLEHVADTGATVVLSSHLVHELERVADRVGVMSGGALAAELPMERFRASVKRLRVSGAPADPGPLPFALLAREPRGREEVWSVSGWEAEMAGALAARGLELREVVDLDLEDAYVELLRTRNGEVVHA